MARPANPNRREDILNAAREEFVRNGFSDARKEDIASRAGISKASVYLQFASKEEVFRDLVRSLIAEALPQIAPADLGERSGPDVLRGFVSGAFEVLTRPDVAFVPRLIVGEGHKFPELTRFYYDEAVQPMLEQISRILRHGVARGEFACEVSEHSSRTVIGGIIVAALWRVVLEPVGVEPVDMAEAAKVHAETLLIGLMLRKEV